MFQVSRQSRERQEIARRHRLRRLLEAVLHLPDHVLAAAGAVKTRCELEATARVRAMTPDHLVDGRRRAKEPHHSTAFMRIDRQPLGVGEAPGGLELRGLPGGIARRNPERYAVRFNRDNRIRWSRLVGDALRAHRQSKRPGPVEAEPLVQIEPDDVRPIAEHAGSAQPAAGNRPGIVEHRIGCRILRVESELVDRETTTPVVYRAIDGKALRDGAVELQLDGNDLTGPEFAASAGDAKRQRNWHVCLESRRRSRRPRCRRCQQLRQKRKEEEGRRHTSALYGG